MEDRHCIVNCLRPVGSGGQPVMDGVERCLAAIYDGHNGTRAADTAASRLHKLVACDAALRTHTGGQGGQGPANGCHGAPGSLVHTNMYIQSAQQPARPLSWTPPPLATLLGGLSPCQVELPWPPLPLPSQSPHMP